MTFRKGESGNPTGRPPKTDHARAAQLRRRILASAPAIIDKLIEAAKSGDVVAGRAVLACCVPTLKPVELPTALPPLPDGLAARAMAILDHTVCGLLSPSQGVALISALAALGKIIETDSLLQRIEAAEQEIATIQRQPPAALPAPPPPPEPPPPEPAPDSPRTLIELAQGESLSDVAEALGITPDELHRQIAAGRIVITPAKESP